MPCFKKINSILFACLLIFSATMAFAGGSSMSIKSASLVALEDAYALNADVDVKFSEKMEEAISKGFELNFLIEFQLVKPHKYWFDDEIVTVTQNVTLSYHALSRQYLVVRGEQQKAFVRLDEAMDDLSYISDLKVLQKSDLEKGDTYKATMQMRLDPKKLPKVLQGDSSSSDDWQMSTQRFEWVPNLSK